jgi:predicted ArsR family transcriptional regulator
MNTPGWNQRFLASTRGRIVALLRRTSRTVNELAAALGLTDNAVRAHLSTLERDGLVQPGGARRSFRKPQQSYRLTPEAEQLFPKAYDLLFRQMIDVLRECQTPEAVDEMLRRVGRRVAAGYLPGLEGKDPGERRARALEALADLGGLAEVEEGGDIAVIRGANCPLAALVVAHPEVCHLAETLISEIAGTPARERCSHGEPPQCLFELPREKR